MNYSEIKISGEKLKLQNIELDAKRNPIILTEKYIVRKYRNGIQNILTEEDWIAKDYFELGDEIIKQGGLLSWANYGCRLGFFNRITDCSETITELIELYSKHEKYELAGKFKDEYNSHIVPNLERM
jgi:hypothetical protein